MNQYRCAMCKNHQFGEPAFKNNAGNFCQACKDAIHTKAHASLAQKWNERKGTCKYCGDIDPQNQAAPWQDFTVCPTCIKWRDRSLTLIRHSGAAAKHIAKVEEREYIVREQRIKAKTVVVEPPKQTEADKPLVVDRLARLEEMFTKLLKNLGEPA